MILHLIRHAKAEEHRAELPDSERALTDKGHEQVKRLARVLDLLDVRYDAIISSPLRRALETAQGLRAQTRTLEQNGLLATTPDGALVEWLRSRAEGGTRTLGLVGHEPFLGELVSLLLFGGSEHAHRFEFRKAALYALEFGPEAQLRFVLPPQITRQLEGK